MKESLFKVSKITRISLVYYSEKIREASYDNDRNAIESVVFCVRPLFQ